MRYGAVFPQYEIETDPAAVRDFAQAVEDMGYDYLLAYEHVLGANPDRPGGWRGPYTFKHVFHEPFVLFGYLAALTQTIEFTTGILILPQRQTALVAKQAAQVDFLSNGRLRLGIGIGWNKVEYDALGEDFSKRGRRSEEQVQLLKRLWAEELVTFSGEFDQIDDAGINPLPVQQPIPLWFGGGADVVLRRMAQHGAGWIPNTMPIDRAAEDIEKLRGYLHEQGRSLEQFGIDVRVNLKDMDTAQQQAFTTTWQKLGATHLCANTLGMGFTRVEQHLDALRRFRQEVGL
ncbi:MAG: LLM class F420-dependent oxidoreductase [Chloroflexota bacterium]